MATTHDHTLKTKGIDITDGDKVKIGAGSNYAEIDKSDGTFRLRGNSSVWNDMVSDLFGKRLYSSAGGVDYDYDNNTVVFASGGSISDSDDRIGGNLEINHEYAVGEGIIFSPHIHWFQDAATKYEITFRYRIQRNGEAMTTDWTSMTITANDGADVYEYDSGTLNQLTVGTDIEIDCGISDTIQFQMARTDSLGGTMSVYFLDIHGKIDSLGSDEIISKLT